MMGTKRAKQWLSFAMLAGLMKWQHRGQQIKTRVSYNKDYTQTDIYSPKNRAKRKVRNKMVAASRKRNR